MNVLDLRTGRWDNPWKDREQVCKPGARRNPAGVTLGRHFIISGGYSEEQFATLGDTWAFDMRRGTLPSTRPNVCGFMMYQFHIVSCFFLIFQVLCNILAPFSFVSDFLCCTSLEAPGN